MNLIEVNSTTQTFQVTPVDIVNISKWIHLPYKLAKAMMPNGFSDKFRLHDKHYLSTLCQDISLDDIPVSLGGNDAVIRESFSLEQSKYLGHYLHWCYQCQPEWLLDRWKRRCYWCSGGLPHRTPQDASRCHWHNCWSGSQVVLQHRRWCLLWGVLWGNCSLSL